MLSTTFMRRGFGAWCAVMLCALSLYAQAKLDLTNPDQAMKAQQKIQCSLTDGKPALFWWKGKVFSRVPGERDRHLFNVDGMNLRACKSLNDPQIRLRLSQRFARDVDLL